MNSRQDKSVIYSGYVTFEANNTVYHIKPMPLKDIVEGRVDNANIAIPYDVSKPGEGQLYNIATDTARNEINEWMKSYLTKNGNPVTIDEVIEDGWDLVDLGRFILEVMQISG